MEEWLDALRSGDYTQTRGVLRRGENCFCAVGLLLYLRYPERFDGNKYKAKLNAPTEDMEADLDHIDGQLLFEAINMNDHECKSFEEIADFLEANG